MSRRIKRGAIVGIVITIFVAVGAVTAGHQLKPTDKLVPTTMVKRGPVEINVYAAGEFRVPKSATLMAPSVSGTLQIISMATTGSKVKKDDVIVEFDPGEQEYNFEQADSQLRQAEQEIIKSKADAEVQAAQAQTSLLKARFDVRRAELEVQRNELLGEIDARKNNLALEESKRKLAQLEEDVKSRSLSGAASLKVLEERRNAARISMQVAQTNIDNMKVKAPIDGVVSVKENRDSTGGFFTSGMVLPEYRAGDLVFPGRMLVEVMDVSQMEVQAKINESDRANVNANQVVDIWIDARPGQMYPAKVKTVAGLASRNFWSSNSTKKFDASFQLDKASDDLRPGISAMVLIHGNRLENVLSLPVQCLFEKDGKQIIYAKSGSGFEPKEIKVKFRTESSIVIEDAKEGLEVALVNPTTQEGPGGKKDASKSGAAGGAMQ